MLHNINALVPRVEMRWRAVATDRYYTSVQLALQLLHQQVYTVSMVQINRRGYSTNVLDKRSKRPASVPRGAMKMAAVPVNHDGAQLDGLQTCSLSLHKWQSRHDTCLYVHARMCREGACLVLH